MYNSEMLITSFSRSILSLLLTVFLISSSIAGINECEKAYNSNNFSVAHIECNTQKLHFEGRAIFIMASMHENGDGIKKDIKLACSEYLRAGRNGYCEASKKIAAKGKNAF